MIAMLMVFCFMVLENVEAPNDRKLSDKRSLFAAALG